MKRFQIGKEVCKLEKTLRTIRAEKRRIFTTLEALRWCEQAYRPQDAFSGHNTSKRRARLLRTYWALCHMEQRRA